jgi:DNA polymerase epsilon subunit 1
VLGLDGTPGVGDAVAVLRRQLLRLLHVREFSAAAEFRDPCVALTLPDVTCTCVHASESIDPCMGLAGLQRQRGALKQSKGSGGGRVG